MTTRVAIIFADTNLFLQCHPLENLDWASWANYDELHLTICRSVQRELDSLKNGTNNQAVRVRRVLKMVRTLLSDASTQVTVRKKEPMVKLCLAEPGLPSSDLRETLDYRKPDDELVGYAYRYCQEHPEADVFLLTHDTGPMATAKAVGLEYREIPDHWLIGSRQDLRDPEITKLTARIKELERQEPQIGLEFLENSHLHDGVIEIEILVYDAMSPDEIESCMYTIKNTFPMQSDFGSSKPNEHVADSIFGRITGLRETYAPASEEEIRRYQNEDYPSWLSRCQSMLSVLHTTLQELQPLPYFELSASNDGSRPARDVLVRFIAQGEFQICVKPVQDTEAVDESLDTPIDLPKPPTAPAGRWVGPFGNLGPMASGLARLERSIMLPLPGESPIHSLRAEDLVLSPDDPNDFYYMPRRPDDPTDSFSLVCAQWRHRTETEIFGGTICFDLERDEIDGALTCEIHAENLSAPVRTVVPVRIRTKRISAEPSGRDLLRRLEQSGSS